MSLPSANVIFAFILSLYLWNESRGLVPQKRLLPASALPLLLTVIHKLRLPPLKFSFYLWLGEAERIELVAWAIPVVGLVIASKHLRRIAQADEELAAN